MSGSAGEGTPEFRRIRSTPTPPEDAHSPNTKPRSPVLPSGAVRRKRLALLLAGTLSILVLVTSGTAWALSGWVSGQINRSNVFGGMQDRPAAGPTGALNFLVIGSDSRGSMNADEKKDLGVGRADGQRADTMMLIHVNEDRDQVSVVGIPRDSWVNIPGHGKNKINSAYAYGGPKLAVETVESATDVRIDHYAEVDFSGFVDVVDAVDGIQVCLSEPIDDPKANLNMDSGKHNVDGRTALAFARTRKTAGGDLDRIERQQQTMAALLDKALSSDTLSDPGKFTTFLNTALGSVTVDKGLDSTTINTLGDQLRTLGLNDVSFAQVPLAKTNYRTPDGSSAVRWDRQAASDLFGKINADKPLSGDSSEDAQQAGKGKKTDSPLPKEIELRVFNGVGTPGLGARARSAFTEAGFQVPTKARNWRNTNVEDTLVRYASGHKREAKVVAKSLPNSQLEKDDSAADQVHVVLGDTYSDRDPSTNSSGESGKQGTDGDGSGTGKASTAKEATCAK